MPSVDSPFQRVSPQPRPAIISTPASTLKKTRSYFDAFPPKKTGSPCSKPVLLARTMCRPGVVLLLADESYELAARHRRNLPTGETPRRRACYHVDRA